jgi:hypothetical protein
MRKPYLTGDLNAACDMTKEMVNAETTIHERSLIRVGQAVPRLGVSKSTVYRINRKLGPFRFVLDGRRIFIGQASFESHLADIRGMRADDGLLPPKGRSPGLPARQ